MNEEQRRRRFLVGVVSVVGLIGITGTTIALVADGSTPTTSEPAPETIVDPMTIEGQCRSAGVGRFSLETGAADPELTATAAVEPWVLAGESTASTSTGENSKLVSIGVPGELPRVVLTVGKQTGGWLVTETGACLETAEPGRAECTEETLRIGRIAYRRPPAAAVQSDPATASTGRFAGSGILRGCPEQVDGTSLVARGPVGPVSAYALAGEPGAVLVVSETTVRVFRR